jgi:predicted  nucleic acid-binding Zn-ribbon protein
MGTRLLALNLRLVELKQELHQTQVRVHQLESQLEDARLAQMVGEEAGDPTQLGADLERFRENLENQREVVDRVKKSQWKVTVQHALLRVKERRDQRERESAESAGG